MKDFKLESEPKLTSGFTTPDGYFDTLSDKILLQLPKQEPKVMAISGPKKMWYFAAAAVMMLLLSVPLYNRYAIPRTDVDVTTLENYLAYQGTISEDDIINLLDKEDIEKMNIEFNVQDKEIEEALDSNSNLEQYIID